MRYSEPGVIGASFVDFTIPSDFAKNALYCCPQVGHFYCNEKYNIERDFLDMYLMFYVIKGELKIEVQGHCYTAGPDAIVLLDCHQHHRYYCEDSLDFMWFHFHGNSSAAYAEYLLQNDDIVFSGHQVKELRRTFNSILNLAGVLNVDEHLLSLNINNILCYLANSRKSASIADSSILPALNYIHEHYGENISLDQLTEICLISKPHLIRCFKKDLKCTPHEYLLSYRLRQAKQMLANTDASIETISENCGFNSISHFSRAFRSSISMTPSEFRKLW